MQRPTNGEHLPTPAPQPAGSGYAPPAGQYAPNPFAVATPAAPPPPAGRALPTVGELFAAFKRRWVIALLVGAVMAFVLAAGVWMVMPSGKHQVRATLQFKSTLTNLLGGGNITIPKDDFDVQVENHKKYMETKAFLDKVASRPEVAQLPVMEAAEDKASAIKNMLTFKRESYEIVTLTLNGDEPEQMQVILTTLVNEYLSKDKEDESAQRTRTLKQVKETLAEVEAKLTEKREAVLRPGAGAVVEQSDIIRMDSMIDRATQTAEDLRKEASRLAFERDQLAGELKAGQFAADPTDEEAELQGNTQVADLRKAVGEAERKLKEAQAKYLAGDQAIAEAEGKLTAAKKAVATAATGVLSSAETTLKAKQKARLEARLRDLTSRQEVAQKGFEQEDKRLTNLVEQKKGLKNRDALTRFNQKDADPLEKRREDLLKQESDLELIDKNAVSRIEVLDKPEIYKNYNLKQKAAFAGVAALAGLLGVCLLVSYLEWRNRRVDGVDQVVTELGMRVIGTIPAFPSRAALRSGEAGANQNWRFILNESVNSTRTMLLHTARTQQMQVILVTSAMQGEGKTSLSSQLATSMATAGLRTLILDCDLRNPSMQKLFDIPVAPGCAEVLLQEIDVSDVVQATSVPNLWIIPAGQCNHRVIAALAQGHPMEALLNRLRGQFDIIVVDSCPILPVADTLLVAQHVDGVVFSILQDVSQLPKVQDASDRLVQLNIPLLGAVVNGIKPDIQAYGYNYVKQLPA